MVVVFDLLGTPYPPVSKIVSVKDKSSPKEVKNAVLAFESEIFFWVKSVRNKLYKVEVLPRVLFKFFLWTP